MAIYSRSSIQSNRNNHIVKRLWIRKINKLLNLTNKQPDVDKINLYAKDQHENKYQILTKKSESIGLKRFNDLKAFIEYSNDM